MKKVILPLLLILAVGILAAVESAPSAVVGYVKYNCTAGNNMLALPMTSSYALASELGDAIGATTVGYFDSDSQLWTTIEAQPWGGWTDDFSVVNGQPLWVTVDAEVDFYSLGSLPATNPSYNLVAGNNVIMLPLNKSNLNLASLVGDDIGATTVGYFDASSQLWTTIEAQPWGGWTDDFSTSIGQPLWITSDVSGVWPTTRSLQNFKTSSK